MNILKRPRDVQGIKYCSYLTAELLCMIGDIIEEGITTRYIEEIAVRFMTKNKVESGFKVFSGYPYAITTSVNDTVVCGYPDSKILVNGDVLSIDCSIYKNGYFSDAAMTYIIGGGKRDIVDTTMQAMLNGISFVEIGNKVRDVSVAIDTTVSTMGFSTIKRYRGHGIGMKLHEEPSIPNVHNKYDCGVIFKEGMVLAIEPIAVEGVPEIEHKNRWTTVTRDGSIASHFEHTVLITSGGAEILTQL